MLGDSLQHGQRGEEHDILGRHVQTLFANDRQDTIEDVLQVEVHAAPLVGIDQVPHLALQRRDVQARTGRDHRHEHIGGGRLVALDEGEHEIEHPRAVALRYPPHAAKVDEPHAAVGHGEEVALVGVGVEVAELEDLPQIAAHPGLDDLATVDPRLLHEVGSRARHALDALMVSTCAVVSSPIGSGKATLGSSAKAARKRVRLRASSW